LENFQKEARKAKGVEYDLIAKAFAEFEQEIPLVDRLSSIPDMDGVLMLVPMLRAFSQAALLGTHFGMIVIERLSGLNSHKIIHDLATASSSKTRRFGQKLDGDTKKVHFDFNENKICITLWRQGVLEKAPNPNPESFNNCLVDSTVIFKAPIADMNDWHVETFIEIERPKKENSNLVFLQQYASLIATLETMGVTYSVKEA
jgi:hypothetical protein